MVASTQIAADILLPSGIDDDKDVAIAIETADTDLTTEEIQRYIKQVLRASNEIADWL